MLLERVTQAGDVAVPEDGENAGEERLDSPVGHHRLLGDEVPDDRFGGGEADGFHNQLLCQSRGLSRSTVSHFSDSHERNIASCTLT